MIPHHNNIITLHQHIHT